MNDLVLLGATLLVSGVVIFLVGRGRTPARRDIDSLLALPARIEAIDSELARMDGRLQMLSEAQESRLNNPHRNALG
jgi:hypothetical protein